MLRPIGCVVPALMLASGLATAGAQPTAPETVIVRSGSVTLRALLWRPRGPGPLPAILFDHGSGRTREELERLGPYETQAQTLGPVFARHGYVILFPFRQGVGLSADRGASAIDLMNREAAAHGQDARNDLQLELLQHRELSDATAALGFLRGLPGVDGGRIAIVGHSFGGSLALLQAAHEPNLRAVMVFSVAGYSWDGSARLRATLLEAMAQIQAPVLLAHAANDYSLNPGRALDARLQQLGKPHDLKIYPRIGRTPDDGHDLPFQGVNIWEADVFAFLDRNMGVARR